MTTLVGASSISLYKDFGLRSVCSANSTWI
jgi:hypothetical protein